MLADYLGANDVGRVIHMALEHVKKMTMLLASVGAESSHEIELHDLEILVHAFSF